MENKLCRKLYYNNNTYFCAKDIIYELGFKNDFLSVNIIISKLRHRDVYTPIELQLKYNVTDVNDPNKDFIKYLKKKSKPYYFLNKNGLKVIIGTSTKSLPKSFKNLCFQLNLDFYKPYFKLEQEILSAVINVFKAEDYKLQYRVMNYSIELYFPDFKLAIEAKVDKEYYTREKEREIIIQKKLNCSFIRYNIETHFNIFEFIGNINNYIKFYKISNQYYKSF